MLTGGVLVVAHVAAFLSLPLPLPPALLRPQVSGGRSVRALYGIIYVDNQLSDKVCVLWFDVVG